MTDIRRTLLWGIFLASLFFIWESWNRHTGQPSMFGPPPATRAAAPTPSAPAPGPAPAPTAGLGIPGSAALGATAAAPVAAPSAASAPVAASQEVTVATDLVRASLDSVGGTLFRVELLKQVDQVDHTKQVVLLDRSPSRLYLAETGLVPPAGGAGLPNHHTPMHVLAGGIL